MQLPLSSPGGQLGCPAACLFPARLVDRQQTGQPEKQSISAAYQVADGELCRPERRGDWKSNDWQQGESESQAAWVSETLGSMRSLESRQGEWWQLGELEIPGSRATRQPHRGSMERGAV